jgi:hypothetical protein
MEADVTDIPGGRLNNSEPNESRPSTQQSMTVVWAIKMHSGQIFSPSNVQIRNRHMSGQTPEKNDSKKTGL